MHCQPSQDTADRRTQKRAVRAVFELADDLGRLGNLQSDAGRLLPGLVHRSGLSFDDPSLGFGDTALGGGMLAAQALVLGLRAHEETLRLENGEPRGQSVPGQLLADAELLGM